MKATSYLRHLPVFGVAVLALAACEQPFGPRANVHDPAGPWVVPASGFTPADGATISDTTPLLDWGDVAGAASYGVQIATSAAGLDTATPVSTSGSLYEVPAALSYGTWYWRVRAANEDGVPAAWSAAWSVAVSEPLLDMVSVTGGTFQMGSVGVAEPVHSVTVSSFLMAKYEVTQALYQTVIGSNPSSFTGDTSRPVETVSWYDAVAFCNALSALESLAACYSINGTTVTVDFTKNGYRLPTEAEWEYAARGGTASLGYRYSGSYAPGDVGWYATNSGNTTHPVGTKAANELGIYDMSGNVWEWCWDWYASYGSLAQTDPTGATSGSDRVLRGGSWYTYADSLRCASRSYYFLSPADRDYGIGFRVVRRGG